MKRKILCVLGIMLIIIGIVFLRIKSIEAAAVKINDGLFTGTAHGSANGNTYHYYFANDNNWSFFDIQWSQIDNDYFWGNSDGSRLSSMKRLVCINQLSSNKQKYRLRPIAIIDIEDGFVKTEGLLQQSSGWKYVGMDANVLARVAWYEGNHTDSTVEGLLNYGYWNQGGEAYSKYKWTRYTWPYFQEAIKESYDYNKALGYGLRTYHSTSELEALGNKWPTDFVKLSNLGNVLGCNSGLSEEAYKNELNAKWSALKTHSDNHNIDMKVTDRTGAKTEYKNNETIVGPYSISHIQDNNSITTKTVTAVLENNTKINGKITKNNGKYSFVFNGNYENKIKKISLTQSYTGGYKGRIIVMATEYSQNRLIMDGKPATISRTIEINPAAATTDVSLQKFIIGVDLPDNGSANQNDNFLNTTQTDLTDRKFTYTSSKKTVEKYTSADGKSTEERTIWNEPNSNARKKVCEKFPNPQMVDINNYNENNGKCENPVSISVGNKVTYRIFVYNNKNTVANNITLSDQIPDKAVLEGKQYIVNNANNRSEITWTNKGNRTYTYTIASLPANGWAYIEMTLKFNSYSSDVLMNTAAIHSSYNPDLNNQTEYRTVDRDYVKMKKNTETDVSMQKYIIGVGLNVDNERTRDNEDRKITNTEFNGLTTESTLNDRKHTYTSLKTYQMDGETKYAEPEPGARKEVSYIVTHYGGKNQMKPADPNKSENPVNIKVGDTVTYRIFVYNNKDTDAEDIVVTDQIPVYASLESVYMREWDADNKETRKEVTWVKNEGNNIYKYTIDSIPANHWVFFDMTLKYNEYIEGVIINTAAIYDANNPYNKTEYRTVDRDYVKMSEPDETNVDVSLQKYIIGVNLPENEVVTPNECKLDDNHTTLKNRKNTYTSFSTSIEGDTRAQKTVSAINKDRMINAEKFKNLVNIEAGDEVTYRIYVYNNSGVEARNIELYDNAPKKYDSNTNNLPKKVIMGKFFDDDGNYYGQDEEGNSIVKREEVQWHWNTYDDETTQYRYTIDKMPGNTYMYFDVTLEFNEYSEEILINSAFINRTEPENNTEYRTLDRDYVKMRPYKVSLEKYISKVNNKFTTGRDGKAEYLTVENNQYIDKTDEDTQWTQHNTYKYDNIVTVSNRDTVYYTLKVKNNGDTNVYIPSVTDTLPDTGINYQSFKVNTAFKYNANNQAYSYSINADLDATQSNNTTKVIKIAPNIENHILKPNEYILINVQVQVTASNMSLNIFKNTAKITDNNIVNKNGIVILDKTPYNNEDSDYFILNYGDNKAIIAGNVWTDTAKNKISDDYNGLFDDGIESKLSGIKVYLYRTGTDGRNSPIADATTDSEGKYSFADKDIYTSIPSRERHIKGPTVSDTINRWNGRYYSYYIIFEYDGITYTSTPDGQSIVNITDQTAYSNGTYKINSNAKEAEETRINFNRKFTRINKDSDIDYDRYIGKTSIDGQEYNIIPQSIHKYNEEKMKMQSATNVITLADNSVLMEQVKYINLGLRGRDTLDLNVKTDIDKISLKVNGVTTDYAGKNGVTVRKSDISMAEDTKNFASSAITSGSTDETQDVRKTDLANSNYNNNQLLQSINVTYKITVSNESKTGVSEVSIIDYYDSRYDFKEVKVENCILDKVDDGSSSSEYNSKIITTQGNGIIYITYELKQNTINSLKGLNINDSIPTFNMAEIYEYTSKAGNNQTEYTRGLIDLDSAPGKASSEKVILTDDYNGLNAGGKAKINEAAISSRPTTLEYYFNKVDLQKIMYEDDTAVRAVIFRVADDPRTIVGKVFRDNTTVNSDKIKTGNGKFDDGEDIVAGATVQLVEYNSNKSPEEIAENEGKVIFSTTTNKDGEYTFYGYIPGNYIIRYSYGNSDYTVLKNKFSSTLNKYSYNGEDYQATNNTGSYGSEKLEHNSNFWYISNEQNGVSTATDNKERRGTVSTNVTNSDSLMTLLNDARDGKELSNENVTTIKNDTYMYASTYMMRLTGEKADENGNVPNVYGNNYRISNMNFGIAEVPVTTIGLKSSVKQFTIKDAAGDNVIAKITKQSEGEWKVEAGNVLAPKNTQKIDVSIEEQKLQGAKMEVTYDITVNKNIEKNYDGNSYVNPVINGIVDFVDNNLSYNSSLGENSKLWETTTLNDVRAKFAKSQYKDGNIPTGTVVKADTDYVTILKTTNNNPLLSGTENVSCDLVLEKTLSSNDATVEDIITSNIETFDYQNKVEILGLNYANNVAEDGSITFRDRVRTADRHIILAGSQYDYAESEVITIHPPTGNNNNVIYYVISIAALGVLAVGIVLIKKFAINKD